MCIGVPMQVVEMRGSYAICEADGKQEQVDMLLVGDQPVGTWILNFLGGAREVLSPENAQQIRAALLALGDVMQGGQQVDHLFADLVDREPQLPDHLKALVGAKAE
ncbi:MAG: HypC/HybG/HupF family hydrogenase formation chaperone [Thiotrichales bacterium]